jgi:hypothetical protein
MPAKIVIIKRLPNFFVPKVDLGLRKGRISFKKNLASFGN